MEGRWQAVEREGRPVLLDPKATPEYGRKIGANTNYVIHPDETIADNFVHLVSSARPDLTEPRDRRATPRSASVAELARVPSSCSGTRQSSVLL
jgi:hypothetical protein